jgi:hypothetical protein
MNFTDGALSHLNPGQIVMTDDLQDPTGMLSNFWNASVSCIHSQTTDQTG